MERTATAPASSRAEGALGVASVLLARRSPLAALVLGIGALVGARRRGRRSDVGVAGVVLAAAPIVAAVLVLGLVAVLTITAFVGLLLVAPFLGR